VPATKAPTLRLPWLRPSLRDTSRGIHALLKGVGLCPTTIFKPDKTEKEPRDGAMRHAATLLDYPSKKTPQQALKAKKETKKKEVC
jgi:hypothetical protein